MPHAPAGDVVLPGLLAVFCRRFDLSHRLPLSRAYFPPCVVGYGAGLLLTYCALWFSWFGDQGQPALLYLVPSTLGTTSLLALSREQFAALWSNDFEGGSPQRSGSGETGADGSPFRDAELEAGALERLLPGEQARS